MAAPHPTTDPLDEAAQLRRWRDRGMISQAEFDIMFRDLDRTYARALCALGDGKIAVFTIGSMHLCADHARIAEGFSDA
jgi:hypothetical protein